MPLKRHRRNFGDRSDRVAGRSGDERTRIFAATSSAAKSLRASYPGHLGSVMGTRSSPRQIRGPVAAGVEPVQRNRRRQRRPNLQFYDSSAAANSGHFVLNGTPIPDATSFWSQRGTACTARLRDRRRGHVGRWERRRARPRAGHSNAGGTLSFISVSPPEIGSC
jgi:hypothetical protein